jgi:hypothetical protein
MAKTKRAKKPIELKAVHDGKISMLAIGGDKPACIVCDTNGTTRLGVAVIDGVPIASIFSNRGRLQSSMIFHPNKTMMVNFDLFGVSAKVMSE